MPERVVSSHFFGWFADDRRRRIGEAQEALRRPTDAMVDLADRATRIVAGHALERFGVKQREVVEVRRAGRDEPGRWVVVARPPGER